ncbi:MAG: hypothetical protein LBU12_01520 [Deltaproteobacteria bacterium]|jgi:hypothetical protein|nr:hypothetical protein [Deltaproteobacteria bacterium]
MRSFLSLTALAALTAWLLSACVVLKNEPLLVERNRSESPAMAGVWTDEQGERLTVNATDFSNTFVAVPPDGRNHIRVTFEELSPNRYIFQAIAAVGEKNEKAVFLTVAELDGRQIKIFFFPDQLPAIQKLAAANGMTIADNGYISAYESVDGLADFFGGLFNLQGRPLTFTKR